MPSARDIIPDGLDEPIFKADAPKYDWWRKCNTGPGFKLAIQDLLDLADPEEFERRNPEIRVPLGPLPVWRSKVILNPNLPENMFLVVRPGDNPIIQCPVCLSQLPAMRYRRYQAADRIVEIDLDRKTAWWYE